MTYIHMHRKVAALQSNKLLSGNIFILNCAVEPHEVHSGVLSVRVSGKVEAAHIRAHSLPLGRHLDKASRLTIQDV